MNLFFAGAEQPLYMRQLMDLDVKHIAISYFEWQRRRSGDEIYKHVPADVSVIIMPGVAKKEDLDFKTFTDDYIDFVERNAEQCLVYGLDAPHCPADIKKATQRSLDLLPNVVRFPTEDEQLVDLAREHERLGVNASLAKATPTNELRRIQATLYGSNITDPKVLKGARFEATTSMAWLSARRFGELWIWSRGSLKHYSAENLGRAVRAHRETIEEFEIDSKACLANDPAALTALAVKSLQNMARSLSGRLRDRQEGETAAVSPSRGTSGSVDSGVAGGVASALVPVIERVPVPLPTILLNTEDGAQKVGSQGLSMRRCNTCNLADACPEFHVNATCAFHMPVEIKNRAQWEAASHYLLEVQMQRIGFARFAEEAEGQVLTPRLGQEMDRFYKMLSAQKDLEQKPDPVPGGAMSRFFEGMPQPESGELNGQQESGTENDGEEDWEEAELIDDGVAYIQEDATSQS